MGGQTAWTHTLMNTNAPAPGWWCKAIEWGAACVVFAVGGLGVAGWMGWWTGAHAIVPRGSALAANAAVVFILLAGAIPSAHARYGRALAGVLVFLGVSALWRHLSGAVLPWDPLPWPGIAALPSGESGAMSATAGYIACFWPWRCGCGRSGPITRWLRWPRARCSLFACSR